jgi:uroporphyrinogen-III synthase
MVREINMLPNKEYKKKLKRERILDAAEKLFSQMNYHEVMIEEVAGLSSIAKGTVYNYFESKEELYFTLLKEKIAALDLLLKSELSYEQNSIDELRSFLFIIYDFMVSNKEFFVIFYKEIAKGESLFSEENELKSILKRIISSGKKENLFRNVDEDFVVELVFGSILGLIQRGIEKKFSGETASTEKKNLFEFILYGILSYSSNGNLPLKNKTIVLTRTVEQSKESAGIFMKLGARVLIFPTLDIVPPESWEQFDRAVTQRNKIDFIIFTSAHSVDMFLKRCSELEIDFSFEGKRVVAVGSKTASVCKSKNVPVHIIPKMFSGEGVVNELSNYKLKGKTIFIPRSAIGREELPKGLEELGAVIQTAPTYNVSLPSKENLNRSIKKLKEAEPDIFIFTSPSTFKNFIEIMEIDLAADYFDGYLIAAIGPATKSAIENRGVKVNVMPEEFTLEGLANAIVNYFNKPGETN